jgi:hypothetical protein
MQTPRTSVIESWVRPIDPITLVLFRIAFGGLMCLDALRNLRRADQLFPSWEFRPPPLPLEILEGLPPVPAAPCLLAAAVAAALIAVGCWVRAASVVFGIAYAALYLWDPTQFNNHHYLIVMLAGWLAVVRPDQDVSWEVWRRPARRLQPTPWWHLGIFLFHIALVYSFGAINKLNADWLQGEPLSIWLAVEQHWPVVGPWLAHPAAKYVFAYGGLVFDAVIVPLLLWRRTRGLALLGTVLFHLTNSVLFRIGPFPWLMLASNVLFLDREATRRFVSRWWPAAEFAADGAAGSAAEVGQPLQPSRTIVVGLTTYALLHCVLPFRVYLYPGNPEWTEEAKNYSWRMMLSHKDVFVGILIVDLADGKTWEVDPRKYLTRRQLRGKGVWGNPRHLAFFARHLRREALARGFRDPFVKVDAVASLNGRPYQYLVDPRIDLSQAEQPFWKLPPWIVPLMPNQPIGDYSFLDPEIKRQRVLEVLARQHAELLSAAQVR